MPDKNQTSKTPGNTDVTSDENTTKAHKEAEKDIQNDPELTDKQDPAADLDEGQLARLEGEK
jgi:hypothetical protein